MLIDFDIMGYNGKVVFASLCISSLVIVLGLVELARYQMTSHNGSAGLPTSQKLGSGSTSFLFHECDYLGKALLGGSYTRDNVQDHTSGFTFFAESILNCVQPLINRE